VDASVLLDVWRGGLPPGGIDSAGIVRAAQREGIAMLLLEALARPSGDARAAVRTAIAAIAHTEVARELCVGLELARVTTALAQEHVRALVFKGAALAYSVYPNPSLRPRTDTDLLVDPAERDRAVRTLEALGYRQAAALTSGQLVSSQLAFERVDARGAAHVIDVHWQVVNPHGIGRAFSFEELWAAADPAPRLSPAARIPGAVDACVLACTHRLAHHQGADRLIWLYDLHLLASQFDKTAWNAFAERAGALQVACLCLDGLDRASETFGTRVPEPIATRLAAVGAGEDARIYVERRIGRRQVLAHDLRTLRSWRSRGRLLWEHAFPPASFIRSRYHVSNRTWLPALYAHRLITGAYRWIRT
jgi:hypothetical protein